MVRAGGRTHAITAFPSTTSVAYLPFLTGCTPGHCNIPSIRWLDRTRYRGRWWRDRAALRSYCGPQARLLDSDIEPDVRTIFELVPESTGIFTPIARGLPSHRDPSRLERQLWGSVAHFALWHQPSDNAVSRHLLRAADAGWRFVFAQFPAVDGYTHQTNPDSPAVRRALLKFDRTVGLLRERLRLRGELDTSLILMVSDHGATTVHTHLDLPEWFRARGIPTLSHPIVWEKNPRAAVMVAGNGSAMVYARPGVPRTERWPVEQLRRHDGYGIGGDLIDALTREPSVAFVAAESERGCIWVGGGDGAAEITVMEDRVSYRRVSGDPLEVGRSWTATPREWLEATWDGPYPDAPCQILDQLRSSRSGDLLVVAREGYDFRDRFEIPEHRSGHGSMIRAHMQTPVWSSLPIPAIPFRTVDLFPSMLDWLGVPVPENIDGQSIWIPGTPGERLLSKSGSPRHLVPAQ